MNYIHEPVPYVEDSCVCLSVCLCVWSSAWLSHGLLFCSWTVSAYPIIAQLYGASQHILCTSQEAITRERNRYQIVKLQQQCIWHQLYSIVYIILYHVISYILYYIIPYHISYI